MGGDKSGAGTSEHTNVPSCQAHLNVLHITILVTGTVTALKPLSISTEVCIGTYNTLKNDTTGLHL